MNDGMERLPYMRPSVARMAPSAPPRHERDSDRRLRALHLNECPYPPSPAVLAAIQEAASTANRYPDAQVRKLTTLLHDRTGIPPDRVVFGTGSEELLNLVVLVAVDPGEHVVMPSPSFPRYGRATDLANGVSIRVPVAADGRNDVDALIAAVTPRTRILFAASPNNPTGWMNDGTEMERLIATCPPEVFLVLDEAYWEFARQAGGPDILPMLSRRTGPWAVIRTFSKAYCLAGLRLGYVLCSSRDVAQAIGRGKAAFNANSLAQAAAVAAYQDEDHLRMVLDSCARERARLDAGCRALGLDPMKSVANFLSIPVPKPATEIMDALLQDGILIGQWREGGSGNVIRISIGLADDTDAVLAALAKALA